MTWTAHCTVKDVSDGPAPIDVLAAANIDELLHPGTRDPARQITSNTEGKIRSVELKLQLDEDETTIKAGEVIVVTGHFTGTSG